MKIKRLLSGIFLTAIMSSVCLSVSWAGEWKKDGDRYWYQNDDGSYVKLAIQEINGAYYGFDTEGYMVTGWYRLFGRQYYFSPESGVQMRNGWMQMEGTWYYLDPYDGHLHLGGPEKIDGKLYYFRWDNGAMRQDEFFCDCDSDNGKEEHGRYFYHATADGSLLHDMEDNNPDRPYERMKYDENGRIYINNWENADLDHYSQYRCDNDEHIRNTQYYREKYGR